MINNNISLSLLVKDKAITEYRHNGRVYVEGRAGSEYVLEIRNSNPFRIEVIVSVDGMSVIDSKPAGPQSSGYVVEANSTLPIPGWKVSAAEAASFKFSGKQDSYAAHAAGSARNTGVIGLLAYREKEKRNLHSAGASIAKGGVMRGLLSMTGSSSMNSRSVWDDSADAADASYATSLGLRGVTISAMSQDTALYASNAASALSSDQLMAIAARNATEVKTVNVVQQVLGTGFGAATDFATTEVTFERGDLAAQMVIYYDEARALKARGIDLSRRQQRFADEPDAFPAMQKFCTPPPGWKG